MGNFFSNIYNFCKKVIIYVFLCVIKIYQLCISPFFPQRCNFRPSCSEYMVEAIKIHGIIRGLYLGVKRILKCTPNREFTYDPVPKKHRSNHHK